MSKQLTLVRTFTWRVFIIIVLCLLPPSMSLIIDGTIATKKDWNFVARFCFKQSTENTFGSINFRFEYPKKYCCSNPVRAILYYDTQWKDVYPQETKSCTDKVAVTIPDNNQVLKLEPSSTCKYETINGNEMVVCTGNRKFISSRARWWYVVFSQCGASHGLTVKYRMEMTNGDTFWKKHFSADEQLILEPNIGFLVIMVQMFVMSLILASVLVSRQLYHYTYKLFMLSLIFENFSLMFDVIYYVKYGQSGFPSRGYKVVHQGCHSLADMIMVLLLILLAKGWTVTRGRISSQGQVKLAVFFTLYTVAYIALYIYEAEAFDPGKVLYLYESPAGIGLCILRFVAWMWFCYGTFFTLKHYPGKASFYYPFWFFYTVWFLCGPIFVIIATYVLAPWVRAKVMNGIDRSVYFVSYAFFMFLTRPTAANKNFPYHVRTSQIGVINDDSPDNFAAHQYAPSENPFEANGKPFSDIAAMFSANNGNQVTFSTSGSTANGIDQEQNRQELLNGTAASTPSSSNSTPPDYANQPNFNLFQASVVAKP